MLFSLLALLEASDTPQHQATCLQCGQCCESFGGHLRATPHDLKRWREHERQDLIDGSNHLGWIWVDPATKQRISPCPHIDRSDPLHVRCTIYADRPAMCRDYPTLAHGKRCLRGVFLGWGATVLIDFLPEWLVVSEMLLPAA